MKLGIPVSAFLLAGALQIASAQGSATLLPQQLLDIPSGQYSGITPVQGSIYAVVHDKASGGGLYGFDLQFLPEGTLGLARAYAFEANAGIEPSRDNEDVVYVPESGSLWVAAEGDQSIREYDLSGYPTGRRLTIPERFSTPKGNAGFESLAYRDGAFWTTTESPLPGESFHRIQRFSLKTLKAEKSWIYTPDEPLMDAGQQALAQAYVHGISAMTVLPDGSLAVLEREVYVPSGGFLAKLASFSETRIYTVRPQADAKELDKSLLVRFRTSALNLANYEGMCLGPVLPDGRRTLLLIADSQDGAGGLTHEYLQVITLE